MRVQAGDTGIRLDVIDALRGFALCGILLINLPHMSCMIQSDEPIRGVRDGGLSTGVWWIQMLLVHGTFRGLFSLLFGASMLLFLAKAERGRVTNSTASWLMIRRLFWLGVFGVVDMTLFLWPGDILTIYALAGLVVLPFATSKPRTLMIAAAVVVAGVSAQMVFEQMPKREIIARADGLDARAARHLPLGAADTKQLKRWHSWKTGTFATPAEIASERTVRLGTYGANLRYLAPISWDWFMEWEGTARWVFDAVGFMLVGMLLYRLGWLRAEASRRTYLLLMLVGYGLGLPLKAIEAISDWQLITGVAHPRFALFWVPAAIMQTARLLVTLGHLGTFMWCWKTFPLQLAPLQALGRMAFTGYMMQSVLAAFAFSGFGLGLWGQLTLAQLWLTASIIWAIEIAFATAWLSRFKMGPFEWVWRSLTYWRSSGQLAVAAAG